MMNNASLVDDEGTSSEALCWVARYQYGHPSLSSLHGRAPCGNIAIIYQHKGIDVEFSGSKIKVGHSIV